MNHKRSHIRRSFVSIVMWCDYRSPWFFPIQYTHTHTNKLILMCRKYWRIKLASCYTADVFRFTSFHLFFFIMICFIIYRANFYVLNVLMLMRTNRVCHTVCLFLFLYIAHIFVKVTLSSQIGCRVFEFKSVDSFAFEW